MGGRASHADAAPAGTHREALQQQQQRAREAGNAHSRRQRQASCLLPCQYDGRKLSYYDCMICNSCRRSCGASARSRRLPRPERERVVGAHTRHLTMHAALDLSGGRQLLHRATSLAGKISTGGACDRAKRSLLYTRLLPRLINRVAN